MRAFLSSAVRGGMGLTKVEGELIALVELVELKVRRNLEGEERKALSSKTVKVDRSRFRLPVCDFFFSVTFLGVELPAETLFRHRLHGQSPQQRGQDHSSEAMT